MISGTPNTRHPGGVEGTRAGVSIFSDDFPRPYQHRSDASHTAISLLAGPTRERPWRPRQWY